MSFKQQSEFKWTEDEDEWFRTITADFVRWKAMRKESKADTHFFVQRAVTTWYEAFPERHPRTYRQHSTTADQAAWVLLGPEMLRMHERVRHKLNYVKKSLTGHELNGGMSGLVDLTTGVLVRRPTEGYRHLLASSPYGPNDQSRHMEDIAGYRLALWKSEDYSASTDGERAEVLRDLPLDMEEIVSTLAKHTGAEFYMLATWQDCPGQAQFYDVLSERTQSFAMRRRDEMEKFRKSYLDHTMASLGTRMAVEMRLAGATVYGGLNEVCRLFIVYTSGESILWTRGH
ncbi:hypothetical protein BDV93DRAFT_516783 [Ceratobasidium sp. AG-I]|nr:hypothetical protein BDV93DRAFT_516783 [Ceratobasidium sp. AG-I]